MFFYITMGSMSLSSFFLSRIINRKQFLNYFVTISIKLYFLNLISNSYSTLKEVCFPKVIKKKAVIYSYWQTVIVRNNNWRLWTVSKVFLKKECWNQYSCKVWFELVNWFQRWFFLFYLTNWWTNVVWLIGRNEIFCRGPSMRIVCKVWLLLAKSFLRGFFCFSFG